MKKFEGKWLPDSNSYKDTCINISINLDNFKRNSIYSNFIGNDLRNEQTAIAFYDYIKSNYLFLLENDYLVKFIINDKIGNPMIYNINDINISPGTLRFMKVLGDILSIDKDIKKIIEIGSGYGGQCLVVKSYSNEIDYNLVDIPESLLVAKSYLSHNNCNAKFISTDEILVETNYDLVISDYCLSELDFKGIDFYLNNIINRCKYGYFTINIGGETFNKIIECLKKIFNVVEINKEFPKTSNHDNHIIICKDNKCITNESSICS